MSKMAVKVDANPIMIKWARENAVKTNLLGQI